MHFPNVGEALHSLLSEDRASLRIQLKSRGLPKPTPLGTDIPSRSMSHHPLWWLRPRARNAQPQHPRPICQHLGSRPSDVLAAVQTFAAPSTHAAGANGLLMRHACKVERLVQCFSCTCRACGNKLAFHIVECHACLFSVHPTCTTDGVCAWFAARDPVSSDPDFCFSDQLGCNCSGGPGVVNGELPHGVEPYPAASSHCRRLFALQVGAWSRSSLWCSKLGRVLYSHEFNRGHRRGANRGSGG